MCCSVPPSSFISVGLPVLFPSPPPPPPHSLAFYHFLPRSILSLLPLLSLSLSVSVSLSLSLSPSSLFPSLLNRSPGFSLSLSLFLSLSLTLSPSSLFPSLLNRSPGFSLSLSLFLSLSLSPSSLSPSLLNRSPCFLPHVWPFFVPQPHSSPCLYLFMLNCLFFVSQHSSYVFCLLLVYLFLSMNLFVYLHHSHRETHNNRAFSRLDTFCFVQPLWRESGLSDRVTHWGLAMWATQISLCSQTVAESSEGMTRWNAVMQ